MNAPSQEYSGGVAGGCKFSKLPNTRAGRPSLCQGSGAAPAPVGAMVPAESWGQEDPRQEASHREGFSQGKVLSLLP